MKKYFLKGKEFITKKLQQLDFETESIDYVGQQIPNRLKEPLSVLLAQEIDLEPTSMYDSYFRSYPTHHLSQYLLEKYQMQVAAKQVPVEYEIPKSGNAFVPKFNKELERKALLLKEVIEEYDEGYTKLDEVVLSMCVVHFHHKRGTEIQYSCPNTSTAKELENSIVHHAMPDSSHNKPEDHNFFNFEAQVNGKKTMVFGVSYFKQIKVTEEMRKTNKELTRSYTQKAVAITSLLPIFGYLKFRLAVTTKLFFNDFTNFQLIGAAYKDISKHLNETWPMMQINELYMGSDLKVIISLFGVQQFYEIWKAVLLERRIVVFAHSSSSASSCILSLLSLFPGLSTFGMLSKPIGRYMQALREYDLPLRLFSSDNFMSMSFHIQDFPLLSRFQKNKDGHFLLGTTNRLLKEANDYGVELLVNLENCSIEKKKSRIGWDSISKREKAFLYELDQIINDDHNIAHGGSEDCIRNLFHRFLKQTLVEMIDAINLFKVFVTDCGQYAKSHQQSLQPVKNTKKSSYQLMEDEDVEPQEVQQPQNGIDYPPLIPKEVTNIPFPALLKQRSFTHFLQFHNKKLPQIMKIRSLTQNSDGSPQENGNQKPEINLKVQNHDYILQNLEEGNFIAYNISEKRLSFGKGTLQSFQGKEVRFKNMATNISHKQISLDNPVPVAKTIYVGMIHNGRYIKSGVVLDENQAYEGDFICGVKHGYGKLTNNLHKYIGYFEDNLYSGDGQLVTGSSVYVGEFKEGLKHGCGKNQGSLLNYDGEWQNDYPHGHGVLILEEPEPHTTNSKQSQAQSAESPFSSNTGNQYIGNFKKGKLDQTSEVTIRYSNGAMYKGQVLQKRPHGKGFMVDQNGEMKIGIFKDGLLIKKQDSKQSGKKVQQKSDKSVQDSAKNQKQGEKEVIFETAKEEESKNEPTADNLNESQTSKES